LQTVFRFLDFSDQLSFRLRTDGIIKALNPIAGVPEEKDLCVRAAKLLKQQTEHSARCRYFAAETNSNGWGFGRWKF
jgi:4-diphosphocytidyl-2-C-methyl-D-erythritol kinase